MAYLIYVAEIENHDIELTEEEYRKTDVSWNFASTISEVEFFADRDNSWRLVNVFDDVADAFVMWGIAKRETHLTSVFRVSPNLLGYKEKVFKLVEDNEDENDPNRYRVLDYHAEGFDHKAEQ